MSGRVWAALSALCAAVAAAGCSGGPSAPAPHAVYAHCNALPSGSVCLPECEAGYVRAGGEGFVLQCDDGGGYDDGSGVECRRVCLNLTAAGRFGSGYDTAACEEVPVGGACRVLCADGYTGDPTPYTCRAGGADVEVAVGGAYPVCFPASCQAGAVASAPGVEYSACLRLSTGARCTLGCLAGHAPADGSVLSPQLELVCRGGRFLDDTGFRCAPRACAGGVQLRGGAPAAADYSPCQGLRSGDQCAPGCLDGRPILSNAYSFTLVCDANETFADPSYGAGPTCGAMECGAEVCPAATGDDCTVFACQFQRCVVAPRVDGTPCGPTGGARCEAGACAAPALCRDVECAPISQCQGPGVCDAVTGECRYSPLADNSPCDDASPFTMDDRCVAGQCTGTVRCPAGSQGCPAPSQCHLDGGCDSRTGLCAPVPQPEFTPCDIPGVPGRAGGCRDGSCVLRLPCGRTTCSHRDRPCMQPVCGLLDQKCHPPVPVPDGVPCDDRDATTTGDACTKGECRGASRCDGVVCSRISQCHEPGACDPATGRCTHALRPEGAPCNDGDSATVGDRCAYGHCLGRSRCLGVRCVASDSCHAPGECDPATGACTDPVVGDGRYCDDGDPRTRNDVCRSGVCVGVLPCGGQVCAPRGAGPALGDPQCVAGECVNGAFCTTTVKHDGARCNDFNPATLGDVCRGGRCAGTDPCAGVQCDAPAASAGCLVTECLRGQCATRSLAPAGTPCDDGDYLTARDACNDVGECVGVALCRGVTCPAGAPCTRALCDTATGRCEEHAAPSGAGCDDGVGETDDDRCEAFPGGMLLCYGDPAVATVAAVDFTLEGGAGGEARWRLRQKITAAVANVLSLDGGAAVQVLAVGDDGGVTALVTTARYHPTAVADAFTRRLRADLIPTGTFAALGIPARPSSVAVAPLTPLDECSRGERGNATCGAATQRCSDPLAFTHYLGDWRCECPPGALTVAAGAARPATCAVPTPAPSTPAPTNASKGGAAPDDTDALSGAAVAGIVCACVVCGVCCAAAVGMWVLQRRRAAPARQLLTEEEGGVSSDEGAAARPHVSDLMRGSLRSRSSGGSSAGTWRCATLPPSPAAPPLRKGSTGGAGRLAVPHPLSPPRRTSSSLLATRADADARSAAASESRVAESVARELVTALKTAPPGVLDEMVRELGLADREGSAGRPPTRSRTLSLARPPSVLPGNSGARLRPVVNVSADSFPPPRLGGALPSFGAAAPLRASRAPSWQHGGSSSHPPSDGSAPPSPAMTATTIYGLRGVSRTLSNV